MLKLSIRDQQNLINEDELSAAILEGSSTLECVQLGESQYKDSQGWLHVDEWANDQILTHIEELADEIRKNSDAFVLIGVGGSNNAARSVIEALSNEEGPEIIYAGNTLSANAMNRLLKKLENKRFSINCIAKNFETLEPGISFRVLSSSAVFPIHCSRNC